MKPATRKWLRGLIVDKKNSKAIEIRDYIGELEKLVEACREHIPDWNPELHIAIEAALEGNTDHIQDMENASSADSAAPDEIEGNTDE